MVYYRHLTVIDKIRHVNIGNLLNVHNPANTVVVGLLINAYIYSLEL